VESCTLSWEDAQVWTTTHHNRFTALFPGPPRWAGIRRELLDSTCSRLRSGTSREVYSRVSQLTSSPRKCPLKCVYVCMAMLAMLTDIILQFVKSMKSSSLIRCFFQYLTITIAFFCFVLCSVFTVFSYPYVFWFYYNSRHLSLNFVNRSFCLVSHFVVLCCTSHSTSSSYITQQQRCVVRLISVQHMAVRFRSESCKVCRSVIVAVIMSMNSET